MKHLFCIVLPAAFLTFVGSAVAEQKAPAGIATTLPATGDKGLASPVRATDAPSGTVENANPAPSETGVSDAGFLASPFDPTQSAGSQIETGILPDTGTLPDTLGLLTRMGLSLLAVMVVIWGVVQVLKRLSPGGQSFSSGSRIRVLERAYIAPKKAIYIVQIGDKTLALGVTDQQMTNLAELDYVDTVAYYAEPAGKRVARRFSDVLKNVNLRFGRRTEEAAT